MNRRLSPGHGHRLDVVLLLCVSLTLCACSRGDDPASSAPYTVVVFKHGKLSGDPRAFTTLLQAFERRHPGVTVREELLPSSTDQQHQFDAMNLEDQPPTSDLLAIHVIWAPEFAKAGGAARWRQGETWNQTRTGADV